MNDAAATEPSRISKAISGLSMRNIGPAFMGGRIADIAIHPDRRNTWFVAVGSGGVWKTTNAGTTWAPVFDEQRSYSIGCVSIDPRRPDVVWVGTGEAVSGRHVGWGDGVYRSRDGGATWQHMGLDRSEHVSEILIHPTDGDTVYVAAEGPLWSAGGERGVYRTTDGGESWDQVLDIDVDTGVTALAFAPDDATVLYAASYQRRRRVWGFLAGGPGSGIHKSTDGGTTWRRITKGLPEGDMGRIGLAVSAADPNLVYATIEAADKERGFYRSTDRGESWERRNEYLSGGTGPHYYQEIFASPSDAQRVYQVDVFLHWTADGGASFDRLETGKTKHSDNHVVWIDPDDGAHLIVGTDAGLYETFDHAASFRHVPNLPISQFYRVAADTREPFYDVLGGAQDLGTLLGPSRTTGVEGVRNQDWSVTLGADGYHVAFDPDDPDICYMEWQNGNVIRLDRRTMETRDIQPQGRPDDPPERWNWDCPIVVSRHDSGRLYVASQRVWRSDDRGESWTPISDDLTRNVNRYELPIEAGGAGHVRSVDSLWDHRAMSGYSTISHLSESPLVDGLLYVGTDDGLVQVTEDGGRNWRTASPMPELPQDAFVNYLAASPCDPDVVFAVADAHKNGDYSPYVFESRDRGTTWTSIAGDLDDSKIVWCIAQDDVEPDLLFVGTELGVFVSVDRGEHWHRVGKTPTIAVRDLVLQQQAGDLVAGSFGRGIFVLDDYAPLRELREADLATEAYLFEVRDAWWYVPHQTAQAVGQPTLGSTAFRAPNPDFGACFTYHLADEFRSPSDRRKAREKDLGDDGDDIEFPGWDTLWQEHVAGKPQPYLVIRDSDEQVVRRIEARSEAGLHRTTWDLRLASSDPVELDPPAFTEPWDTAPRAPLVVPGTYTVELVLLDDDGVRVLTERRAFFVRPAPAVATTPGLDDAMHFHHEVWDLRRRVLRAADDLNEARKRLRRTRGELERSASTTEASFRSAQERHEQIETLARRLVGDPVRERLSEAARPSIKSMVGRIAEHLWTSTQPPTQTQHQALFEATAAFEWYLEEAGDLGLDAEPLA